jgi:hypothetical protein
MNNGYTARQGISDIARFFLIILAISDLIAVIPWFGNFHNFLGNPTSLNALFNFIFILLSFLFMHVITIPISLAFNKNLFKKRYILGRNVQRRTKTQKVKNKPIIDVWCSKDKRQTQDTQSSKTI